MSRVIADGLSKKADYKQYGLGNDNLVYQGNESTEDANQYKTVGVYYGGFTNGPHASSSFLSVEASGSKGTDDERVKQKWMRADAPHLTYTRSFSSGSWGNWQLVYDQDSILGTVSQSAGVPTGAIIERGSNANGRYTKYADGTLICDNSNAAITTNPATFSGTVTSVDGDKVRFGRWF